ncbi:hypothetical protein DFP93_103207 [Aneurinibacillus soli]|uniref:Uncharacterized protein n=1 Tax=Aneurinibacillus soli TaxID=1500254 RepID=A0A0U5B2W2_9BACL|nr:hypothetical protein [Aneurinibacillus soli]PYE62995.1 hypothetical protein DFP93_103207 [Aneurinibacillus soli]BAU28946.1 hypothetical protein CB4_03123 [Aneurinibacillus soli]
MAKLQELELNGVKVRLNNGMWEINDGTGWKTMAAIKSFQRGLATAPSTASTFPNGQSLYAVDVTISAVDITKTSVRVWCTSGGNTTIPAAYAFLSNTTLRLGAGLPGSYLQFEVTEYA